MNSTKKNNNKTDYYKSQFLPYIIIIIILISLAICFYHYRYKTCIIEESDEDIEEKQNLLKYEYFEI